MTDGPPQTPRRPAAASRAGDRAPDTHSLPARSVLSSSASVSCSSPKDAPSPLHPARETSYLWAHGLGVGIVKIGEQNVHPSPPGPGAGSSGGRRDGPTGSGGPASPAARSAHARPAGEPRRRRPRFLSPNHPPGGRRRVPRAPRTAPGAQSGRRARDGGGFLLPPLGGPGTRDPEPWHPGGPAPSPRHPHLSRPPGKGQRRPQRGGKAGSRPGAAGHDPGAGMGSGSEGAERREGAAEAPKAGHPPPRWVRPAAASCPGSASQLQPEEKSEPPLQFHRDPSLGPGPPPGPAMLQPRTPPHPDAARQELACRGTRPTTAPAAGPPRRLLPPLGFKLKFPGWGRQRTRRAGPAPSRRKPLPRPAGHAPGAETPAGRSPPPRPGHAHRPRPRPHAGGTALPAGLAARRRRYPGWRVGPAL